MINFLIQHVIMPMLKYVPWTQGMCGKVVGISPVFLIIIPDRFKTKKRVQRQSNANHCCCTMSLFVLGCKKCIEGPLKNVCTLLDLFLTVLRSKKCVKKLLKNTRISWVIFLTILRHKKCLKKLLKMNQKPCNMYQTILRQKRYVKRQCTEDHTHWGPCP